MSEERLREKLRKIEALCRRHDRPPQVPLRSIRRQFNGRKQERAEEFKFSISDPWSRQLFIVSAAAWHKPFRYARMHRQTVIVRAPASFVRMTLWPEFEELSQALTSHLDEITQKIIREEVHEATQDAEEVSEPRQLR